VNLAALDQPPDALAPGQCAELGVKRLIEDVESLEIAEVGGFLLLRQ